ncbi:hypothetical protein Halru_2811 [Halovivax ruber XH-70]|uniref:Uncharacterized protein n=1 Tax=Halovivax ruber (strain DSM 18193 / JCM 13892 / XH-70) TaxID=797302 RepID=L0IHE0_HALRX|nr:hypothetical protein [Halovivax ruber]AGB17382.1 hypothetical protein Halru_2811 [Halovivax ruber XH-70]
MGWLREEVEGAIEGVIRSIQEAFLGFADDLFQSLLKPIVGVPSPTSDSRYIVIGEPDNSPWDELYSEFYLQHVVPLTIMLLFLALAFIGLRSGSISNYKRKRLLRRLGLVFLGTFVWFPIVSLPLQLVNDIGMTLAPIDDMSGGFGELIKAGVGGVFVTLLVVLVSNFLLFVGAFIFAIRYLSIILLTLLMPLLGVLWAMDIWPISPASQLTRRAAGVYPGLILAGIPCAVVFRIGWQLDPSPSTDGLFSMMLGLALIPTAFIAAIMTVYWSAPAMKALAHQSVQRTNPAAAGAATKRGMGTGVRGARNVHRGYSTNTTSVVTKDGEKAIENAGSRTYKIGSAAQSTKNHAHRYNNLRNTKTGRMRDKAKLDAGQSAKIAKSQAKQSFRNTKNKVSRW